MKWSWCIDEVLKNIQKGFSQSESKAGNFVVSLLAGRMKKSKLLQSSPVAVYAMLQWFKPQQGHFKYALLTIKELS